MTHRSRIAVAFLALAGGMAALGALGVLLVATLLVDGVFVLFDWRGELTAQESMTAIVLLVGTIVLFAIAASIFWRDGVKRFLHLLRYLAEGTGHQKRVL